MNDFLFISDFDGTATAQDFFKQIMYRYKPDMAFSDSPKFGTDLLCSVLNNIGLDEADLEDEIKKIPLDPYFVSTVKFIKNSGFEFVIVSAGFKYYIEKRLEFEGLNNIKIIANESFYEDGGIKYVENKNSEFYCDYYGIDKTKIVMALRKQFKKIAYAGDSKVDFDACRLCDVKFAKNKLAEIFDIFSIDYYEFKNFNKIKKIIEKLLTSLL